MAQVKLLIRSSADDSVEVVVPRANEKVWRFGDRPLTGDHGEDLGLLADVIAVMLLNDPEGKKGATLTISWKQHSHGWYTGNAEYALHFKFVAMDAAKISVLDWDLPPVPIDCLDKGQTVQNSKQIIFGLFDAAHWASFNGISGTPFTPCGS